LLKKTSEELQKRLMGKRIGLSENQRQRAMGMLTAGCSQRDVAKHFNVHPPTICRLWNRFRTTGDVSDRQRSGRPRKTTVRLDRFLVMTSRCNRFMAATKVAEELRRATGVRLCGQSVRNRLRSVNLRAQRPLTAIPLTQRHRQSRMGQHHRHWIQRQWNEVLFTDESRFNVEFTDGRVCIYTRKEIHDLLTFF
jgi:transposase